ncbi:MAG TPA: glycosyltransferase [Candidatus Angelobacter sp.]|nr:glycosyltransferase [Candidatus Angelobacter sp.]
MKITIFGLTISSSWGNGHATPYRAILRALHRTGHQVHFFEKDVPYYSSRRDFESCDYCKLTLYPGWTQVRELALQTADESDVVITASYLPDGQRICDEILELDRPLRVFYDLDTPITLKNMKNGGVEYLRADQIPAFDLVLSFTGGNVLQELEEEYGARMVRPLYGCADPEVHTRVKPSAEFACDLSYMGTFAPDRQRKLDQLFLEPARRNPASRFLLAGPLYPTHWQWPDNIRRIEHVAPEAHPRFYSSSRITLNITREEMARNGWCPSGRFFEAAACGTPLITDWWEGLESFFDLERDLRVVTTPDEVEAALNLPYGELLASAEHARARTLEEHSGEMRARQLLQYFEEAQSMTHWKAAGEEVAS